MNSSEQTTVATLAVFFALIFLLIMITMCCILRRGCRKETTREGHKRYRFRSDWDKSGTMTSSETRITEAIPPNDNASGSAATSDKNHQGTTGVLVRIEEETTGDSCSKAGGTTSRTESSDKRMENCETVQLEVNECQRENSEANCQVNEDVRLIDEHCKRGSNHADNQNTTCSCISTHLNSKKKRENRKDKHVTTFDEPDSSNCSTGESLKDLINDSDTAGLSEEQNSWSN